MTRIARASGLVLATGLALGALTGTAAADNNANVQNITIPVCLDVIQVAGLTADGCNVVDKDANGNISVHR
ncbi:hypothetical protein KIK06_26670 [Nocardiopsis sp. EMB25]|uniref:hypothetical protein n=1 Tax=Nocardiopsis TaxID=2013 RepID=UPI0003474696|nr:MULTISPECIES: hypothetical protein [Nocardiopsis]MCY9787471.1 hypothetical protein [Nocardiopsis sp. EMB25]